LSAPEGSDPNAGGGSLGFRVIGAFKIVCALLFVGVGVGVFKLVNKDLDEALPNVVALLGLDPENHYLHGAIARVSGIAPSRLKLIGVGTFLYAALYLVEGVGLILEKRWAGYLTVVATGLLVPLEGYEVVKKPTGLRLGVLVLNLALVAYVAWRLRQERRQSPAEGVTS